VTRRPVRFDLIIAIAATGFNSPAERYQEFLHADHDADP
jgi:hypothetical protein